MTSYIFNIPILISDFNAIVDGSWGRWSNWETQIVPCGLTSRSRLRHCDSPPNVFGGKPCAGDSIDVTAVLINYCPGINSIFNMFY